MTSGLELGRNGSEVLVFPEVRKSLPYSGWVSSRARRLGIGDGDVPVEMKAAYESWQAVRAAGKTGFEGYFVGNELSPQKVWMKIADLGRMVLSTEKQLHPEGFWHFGRVARGEKVDVEVLRDLDAIFGSLLGRGRALVSKSPEGTRFRNGVRASVMPLLKSYAYYTDDGTNRLMRSYRLPKVDGKGLVSPKQPVDADPKLIDGFEFMKRIGMMGEPMLRLVLNSLH